MYLRQLFSDGFIFFFIRKLFGDDILLHSFVPKDCSSELYQIIDLKLRMSEK